MWERPFATLGPIAVAGQLVSLSRATAQVMVLDPSAGTVKNYPVAPRARSLTALDAGVLVIGGEGGHATLDRVLLNGEQTRVDLPAPYDHIWINNVVGTKAILTFDPNAPQAPGGLPARNNNEIALLDLSSLEVTPVLLKTESLSPHEVIFSDEGSLAAVLFDSSVALIDLSASPVSQVTVPLRLADGSILSPLKGLFAPDASHFYLRVRGSSDLLSLELTRAPSLRATVNFLFLPDAQSLLDIARIEGYEAYIGALFRSSSGSAIALLEGSGDTSKTKFAQLGGLPTQILDLGEGHLLACGKASNNGSSASRYVAAWSIETGRLDEDALPGSFLGSPRSSGGKVFFAHGAVSIEGQTAAGAISVLRVEEDALRLRVHYSPVLLQGQALLPTRALSDGRLAVVVNVPRLDSGAPPDRFGALGGQVAYAFILGPSGESLMGLVLDDAAQSIESDERFIYVQHNTGDITTTPLSDFQRSASHRYRAFSYNGLLDAEEIQ